MTRWTLAVLAGILVSVVIGYGAGFFVPRLAEEPLLRLVSLALGITTAIVIGRLGPKSRVQS
jgi:hypothetical protein